MATILVSDTNLTNIANAIREKNGETTSYKVNEMANAIENISVSSGATEDLSSELSTQNSLITTQETTIDSIISALEGKASGGSGKVLTGGNISFTRVNETTALAGYLKMSTEFDGTKQYKINLCQDVLFNGAVPDSFPALSFDLDLAYSNEDELVAWSSLITPADEYSLASYLISIGVAWGQYVTAAYISIIPSYGIAQITFDTSDTSSVSDFTFGVWLEEA